MKVPFIPWLVQGIPESIGIAAVVISLSLHRLHWKLIVLIGLIQAVIMYTVRLLPLTFGVHTVLLIISLSLLSAWIAKIDLRKAIINANIAMMILAFSEFAFIYATNRLGICSYEVIFKDSLSRILTGMPQVTVLYLVAFYISKKAENAKNITYLEG